MDIRAECEDLRGIDRLDMDEFRIGLENIFKHVAMAQKTMTEAEKCRLLSSSGKVLADMADFLQEIAEGE